MERDIWEEADYPGATRRRVNSMPVERGTLSNKIRNLEDELTQLKREKEAGQTSKEFKFPFKWMWKFNQSRKAVNIEKVLIMFLNKKNEIEKPMFVPIYSGNIVIYKNKAYEFDPRGIWRLKGVKGYPSVYLIREIDRRPLRNPDTRKLVRDNSGRVVYGKDAAVSNMDIEDVRARGDSTESDEFLIKAALKAYTDKKDTVKANWVVIGIIIVIVAVGAYFLFTSGSGAT